jgi:hypothetical protein
MGGFSYLRLLMRERKRIVYYLNPFVHTCVDHPNLICPACSWAAEQQLADALVWNHGSVWLFNPLCGRAQEWVEEHVLSGPWQWPGGQLAVELRFAPDLIEAMRDAGLIVRVHPPTSSPLECPIRRRMCADTQRLNNMDHHSHFETPRGYLISIYLSAIGDIAPINPTGVFTYARKSWAAHLSHFETTRSPSESSTS